MNACLIKIDAAAALTGQSVSALFERAAGAGLMERALIWVWDFSNGEQAKRRDLRFWREELSWPDQCAKLTGEEVIARILPLNRVNFHAGEVDQMFQIRHRTRLDFGSELVSAGLLDGRNFYSRDSLAQFLRRRWLSARMNLSPDTAAINRRASAMSRPGEQPLAKTLLTTL